MADAEQRPKYKRSAKNYLLDTHFQLKYTGFLVLIALALSVALGLLLGQASSEILEQTRRTVEEGKETVAQGQATVDRGEEVIKQSNKVNEVVSSQIELCYSGNEPLLQSFKDSAAEDQKRLTEEQKRLTDDKAALVAKSSQLEKELGVVKSRQRNLMLGLVGVLAVLVFAIGLAGIVFTHKIAGPIYKMKRLFRQVGEGKLVLREKLRKGDELQHFFEAFEAMVESMRERQKLEIGRVDAVLDALQAEGSADGKGASALRALRDDMVDHLEP